MKSVIEIKNVSKRFPMDGVCVVALKNINLTINKGEYVAITGQSGSGKSTMMNLIGCLDKPTEGDILIDGSNVSKMTGGQLAEIRNKKIGFVFQSFNLLSRTSALDNVQMPLIYAGFGASQRKKMAQSLLEKVGLAERLSHQPNQLSGGQQQRVAIARALVNNPEIIMADEPTGNLDSKSGREIMKLLADLHRQNHTIILVTHDVYLAKEAKRQVILKDGEIIKDTKQVDRKMQVPNNLN